MVVVDSYGNGRLEVDKSDFWWEGSVLPTMAEDFAFGFVGRTPGPHQTVPESEFRAILHSILKVPSDTLQIVVIDSLVNILSIYGGPRVKHNVDAEYWASFWKKD